MLSIAALNAPSPAAAAAAPDGAVVGTRGETLEAQEARAVADIESALKLVAAGGREEEAKSALRSLLAQPLVAAAASGDPAAASSLAVQVRAAACKNLATLLAGDDATASEALTLHCAALDLGGASDVVAARAAATLAGELGAWALARRALEAAAAAAPRHPGVLEALADVCLRVGDWASSAAAATALLTRDPGHPRAAELLRGAQERGGGVEPRWPGRARPAAARAGPPPPPRALTVAAPTWADALVALARAVSPADGRPARGRRLCDGVSVAFRSADPVDGGGRAAADGDDAKPARAAPVRASARLTGGDGGGGGSGPVVDALAGVLPWLGAGPAGEESGEERGGGGPTASTAAPATAPAPSAADADAVRALMTGPAARLGLGALAAAALGAALTGADGGGGGAAALPRRALLAALRLDRPTRGWPRPPPAALALAELHAAAAADPGVLVGAGVHADGDDDARGRRTAAEHAASAAVCLADAAAAVAAAEADLGAASPDDRALVARYRWTAARLAEARRAPAAAADHLKAADAALTASSPPLDLHLAHAATLLAGSPVDAAALVSPSTVAARLQALGLMAALADGRARVAAGAASAAALVADLAPRVLAPAGRRGAGGAAGDARRQLLEAALLLADAAAAAAAGGGGGDGGAPALAAVELRARCLILSHLLPRPPPPPGPARDAAGVAGPLDGAPPPGVADPTRAARPTLDAALTATARFAAALADGGGAAAAVAADGAAEDDVHGVVWQLAAHVERCFWACGLARGGGEAGGGPAAPARGKPPPAPPAAHAALATASSALLALWRLDGAAPRGPGAAVALADALGGLARARRVPLRRRAPLLRAAAAALAAELAGAASAGDPAARAAAQAHATCLWALYGARLPDRDPGWAPVADGGDVGDAGVADLAAGGMDACGEAWRLLAPAAAAAVGARDAARAAALTPALQALQAAVPDPAPDVLAAWSPQAVLDGGGEDALLAAAPPRPDAAPPSPAALAALLRVPPSLAAAIAADPTTPVHASLHSACVPLADGVTFASGAAAAPGAWLSGGGGAGEAALAAATRGPSLALCYAPAAPAAWRALARLHAAAAEALLLDAARAPAPRWAADDRARDRHAALVRRARAAALAWRACVGGGGGDAAAADALVADLALARARRDPPADPRAAPGDAAAAAAEAATALERAAVEAPRDWRVALALGRAVDKKDAAADPLPLYARATALSALAHDGAPALEPFYRLHAARLKLGLALWRRAAAAGAPPPAGAVAGLARFCFGEEAAAAAAAALMSGDCGDAAADADADADAGSDDDARGSAAAGPPPSPATAALSSVLDDAAAALAAVAGADRHFHKARYRAARAAAARGDPAAALAAVRPLVTSTSGKYGLATYRIAAGEVVGEAPADPPATPAAPSCDRLFGGRPPRFAPPGVAETERGHARRVCAHVRLHARVAAAAGEGGELAAAAAFLGVRANREGLPGLDAAARLVQGLHFAAVVHGLRTVAAAWFTTADGGGGDGGAGAAGHGAAAAAAAPDATSPRRPRLRTARPPSTPAVAPVFERAAALYAAHVLWPEKGTTAPWADLVAAAALPPDAAPWASEVVFGGAARGHCACLEAGGDFEALAALAGRLRPRRSLLRDGPRHVRALATEAAAAAPRALALAVDGLAAAAEAGVAAERAARAGGADAAAARAAGAAASDAAGWPRSRAWAVLRGVVDARKSWAGDGGGGGGSGGGPLASDADLDAALARVYGAYRLLAHGAAAAGAPPVTRDEASAGADDLVRAAQRAGAGAPPPVPGVPVGAAADGGGGVKRGAGAAGVGGGEPPAKEAAK